MQTQKSSTSSWSSISSIFRFNRGDENNSSSSRSNSLVGPDVQGRQRHHIHTSDRKHSQRSSVSSVSSEASSSSSLSRKVYGTLAFRDHDNNKDHVIHNNDNSRINYKDGSYRDGILMAGKRSSSLPNPHHHQHQYQDDNFIIGVGVGGGGITDEPNTTKPTEIELENYRLAKQKLGGLLRELQKPADKVHYRVRRAFDDLRDLYEDELKSAIITKSFGHDNDNDDRDENNNNTDHWERKSMDIDCAAAIARTKIMQFQDQGMQTSRIVLVNNGECGGGDSGEGVKNRSFFCGCIKIPS